MSDLLSPKRSSFNNTHAVRSPLRDRNSFTDNKAALLRSPQRRSQEDKATVMVKSPIILNITPGERASRTVTVEIPSLELQNLGSNPISSIYCTLAIDRSQETACFVSSLLTRQSKSGKVTYNFHREENQLRSIHLMENSVRVARLKIFAQGFDGELIGEATYPLGPFCAESTSTTTMTILKNRKKVGEAYCTLIRPMEGYLDDSASEDADQASATPSPMLLTTGHIQSLQRQLQQQQQTPSVSLNFAPEHEVLIVTESSPLPPAVTASPLRSPRRRARSILKSPEKKPMPSPFPSKIKVSEQPLPIAWRQQLLLVLAVVVVSVMTTLLASGSVKLIVPVRQPAVQNEVASIAAPVHVDENSAVQTVSDRVLQLSAGLPAMVEFRLLANDAHRPQCLTWVPSLPTSSSTTRHAVSKGKSNWLKELLSTWSRLLQELMFWRKNDHHQRANSASKFANSKVIVVHGKEMTKRSHQSLAVGMCGQSASVWSVSSYDEVAMTITPALYQQGQEVGSKCLSILGPSLATCTLERDGYLNVSMQWMLNNNVLAPAVLKATSIDVQLDDSMNDGMKLVKSLSELKMVAVIKSLTMVAGAEKGQVKFKESEETFDSITIV